MPKLKEEFAHSFMQPEFYQGDVIEVEQRGESFFMPLEYYNASDWQKDHIATKHKNKFLARMSAFGYLDCTDWSMHDSLKNAEKTLIDMYGE